MDKQEFKEKFRIFLNTLENKLCENAEWKIKGFIDSDKSIFSLSNDTKLISKILEIHIFPFIAEFAKTNCFDIILPTHQNYYPDLSFVSQKDSTIKFALDLKTTYRNEKNPHLCNGFTLGSHGDILEIETQIKIFNFLTKNI